MTISRHFSPHRAHASTNGRETGSNWVDLSLFGQILIVPGAVNNEIDGKGKFRDQLIMEFSFRVAHNLLWLLMAWHKL